MTSSKPTIFVVPGAWHPASCANTFIESLRSLGYPAEGLTLRSVGDATIGVEEDTAFLKSAITPAIDEGRDVVLLVHSYAGFPGTAAISGLDKTGREKQGLKGGVLGIIYLAAFVPGEGDSIYGLLSNNWLWWMTDKTEEAGVIETHDEIDVFYNDCDPEAAKAVISTIKPHSVKSFKTSPPAIGWREPGYNGRRGYIRCLQDKALIPQLQDMFIAGSGVDWVVKTLDSSHSPFMSMPNDLAKTVEEVVQEFQSA